MSLTFYFAPMCTATLTTLVIEELGIPVERVKLDLKKGETQTAEYKKINPNGLVPCVVHDGVAIWESAALTMYLGEMFGVDKGLYPAPGPHRGEAMKWIVWTNASLGEAAQRVFRNTMDWYPADQKNAVAGEAAGKDVAKLLGVLDEALTGKQFLLGDYTVADTHVHSICDWLRMMKLDFGPFANITAWSERCKARPAYQKVMAAGG